MSEIQNRIDHYLKIIKDHSSYLEQNEEKIEIYNGKLLPYVDKIMKETLSPNYYNKIKQRLVPVNVLTRVMDKMSKVYIKEPDRISKTQQEWVNDVEKQSSINMIMGLCDTYSNLAKGYLLQPYTIEREIRLRPIFFDKFIPLAENDDAPELMTGLILIMGELKIDGINSRKLYYYYSKDEFIPFFDDGTIYSQALDGNDGVNPFGFIPFVYGNRDLTSILPAQDTDICQITKMIPVALSDLGGAILFQCFSIMYGVDIKAENLTMSPNAFWSLKSDSQSEKNPQIGVIKPQADIDKVMEYIKNVFSLWLETKGVRIGSVGSMDAQNSASGISKIIDEMDVFEIKKTQIKFFEKEERELWKKLVLMNNHWSKQGEIDTNIIPEDTEVTVVFDDPKPEISRKEEVETLKQEVEAGFTDKETAMRWLHPDLSSSELKKMMKKIEEEKSSKINIIQGAFNGMDQGKDQNTQGLPTGTTESNSPGNN